MLFICVLKEPANVMPRSPSIPAAIITVALLASAACEGGGTSAAGLADAGAGDPQVPPMGRAALEPWLAAGHHRRWRCETNISPPRLNGAHGRHLVCSNALIMQEAATFPVGAASVKELFDDANRPNGYAVGIKIAAGEGDATWYWYERIGRLATLSPVADGIAVRECGPMCHRAAPRDNVFVRAPPP